MSTIKSAGSGIKRGDRVGSGGSRRKIAFAVAAALFAGSGAFLLAPEATAQAVQVGQGTVYGTAAPAANQTVTITDASIGFTRTVNVGSDGQFRINVVPAGTYTATLSQNGAVIATQKGITVISGVGTPVNFASQQTENLGTISVTANTITPIDVTTSSTSVNVDATQVNKMPVNRDVMNVALLAPTVSRAPQFNVPSFGGSSSAENAFYVDGMNVTDDRKFLVLAQPPFEALNSFQVMTGGISAAYGNSTGGVVNMTTKSGTNDFHAGFDAYWQPPKLRDSSPNVAVYNSQLPGSPQFANQAVIQNDEEQSHLRYNLWASGPLIQDHLFYYVLAQETSDKVKTFNTPTGLGEDTNQKTPYLMTHINWNINPNNLLSLTYWKTNGTEDGTEYHMAPPSPGLLFSDSFANEVGPYTIQNGSKAIIGKYTWYLSNNFNLSALYGYLRFDNGTNTSSPDCPVAWDRTVVGVQKYIGCWVQAVRLVAPGSSDTRHEWRIDGEWFSGDSAGLLTGHDVTFGYTKARFGSNGITHYSGPDQNFVPGEVIGVQQALTIPGITWTYRPVAPSGITNGVCYVNGIAPPPGGSCPAAPTGSIYVSGRSFLDQGYFFTDTHAWYIEDNWHLTPDFYLQLGVRNQGYSNYNEVGQAFVTQANEWGPRLGFSWNVNGDSTSKLYGSYARYYIPVANNTNIRAAGGELDVFGPTMAVTGWNPATGAPTGQGQQLGPFTSQGSGGVPDPRTVATRNLTPLSVKEFILGWQKGFGQYSFGIQGEHRWLVDDVDDQCWFMSAPPFKPDIADFARSKGWNVQDFLNTVAPTTCLITNPGQDIETYANVDGATNPDGSLKLEPITIPNSFVNMPTGKRTFDAVTFSLTRSFTANFSGGASFTWSHLFGNTDGYVTTAGQTDAGITTAFDTPGAMVGSYGNLGNDHRYTLKAWGQWQFLPDWRAGFNTTLQSGMPLTCVGSYPDEDDQSGSGQYCGGTGGVGSSVADGFPYGSRLIIPGTIGTTPWMFNLDLQLAWTPTYIDGLTVRLNWFNVLNRATPVQQNPTYDSGFVPLATYQSPLAYQTPTYVELALQYQFK